MNPIYEAALEGRYPIDLQIEQKDGEWHAKYERHGLKVHTHAMSQLDAVNRANQEVMEGLKSVTKWDYLHG